MSYQKIFKTIAHDAPKRTLLQVNVRPGESVYSLEPYVHDGTR